MSKALDTVDHSTLVLKLEGYGVADPLLAWISYLTDYLLRVGCSKSTLFLLSSGVNQGSLLGPCLFNIFTNYLLEVVSVNTLQFANDLKIFTEVASTPFRNCGSVCWEQCVYES